MKTYRHLSDRFSDYDFCRQSILDACEGKDRRRVVRKIRAEIAKGPEDRFTDELHEILTSGFYNPAPLGEKVIWDERSQKLREIHPTKFFPDQCVHWAMINVSREAFMHGMYDHSVGNIPGRGQTAGVKYIRKVLDEHPTKTKYALYFDIHHFYASINRDILMRMLEEKIDDDLLLHLYSQVIYSYSPGLPLGNYTSQWLSNFYLQEFDHRMKEEWGAKYYCRNVDDCIVIGPNKRQLHRLQRQAEAYLNSIGLEMKPNWQIYPVDARGIDYLGYRFYHDHTEMRKRNFRKFRRQSMRTCRRIEKGENITFRNAAGLLSRNGNLKWCDSDTIQRKYLPKDRVEVLKDRVRAEAKGKK